MADLLLTKNSGPFSYADELTIIGTGVLVFQLQTHLTPKVKCELNAHGGPVVLNFRIDKPISLYMVVTCNYDEDDVVHDCAMLLLKDRNRTKGIALTISVAELNALVNGGIVNVYKQRIKSVKKLTNIFNHGWRR